MLLAVMGLHSALSYTVSRRPRGIGMRIAVGADRSSEVGMVLRDGLPMVVTGLAMGLGAR